MIIKCVGATGVAGNPGLRGQDGAQGVQGPVGAQGSQGNVGPAGAPGIEGGTGVAGQEGRQGVSGQKGNIGPSGPTGLTGPQGTQGNKGTQGNDGHRGNPGATGHAGPQGQQGEKGNDYIFQKYIVFNIWVEQSLKSMMSCHSVLVLVLYYINRCSTSAMRCQYLMVSDEDRMSACILSISLMLSSSLVHIELCSQLRQASKNITIKERAHENVSSLKGDMDIYYDFDQFPYYLVGIPKIIQGYHTNVVYFTLIGMS